MDNENDENQEKQSYNPELDAAVKKMSSLNVKVLTLKDINGLRQARDIKRQQLINDATIDAALYSVPPEPEGGMGI